MTKQVLQQARTDMKKPCPFCPADAHHLCGHVNSDALAQQVEQQPVAWRFVDDEDNGHVSYSSTPPTEAQAAYLKKWNRPAWEPLYAGAAPAAQPDTWTDDGGWTFPIEKPAQPVYVMGHYAGEGRVLPPVSLPPDAFKKSGYVGNGKEDGPKIDGGSDV